MLGGAQYATVANEQKMVQDLGHYILESMGTDYYHPGHGSLIDGGIRVDGTYDEGIIGNTVDEAIANFDQELQRLVKVYQERQLNRAKNDNFDFHRSTQTRAEILVSATIESWRQIHDSLVITIRLASAKSASETISLPVPFSQEI